MKPLGTTYRKNGFHYEIIRREGLIAIAQQRLAPGRGCLAFEVIKIRECPEANFAGTIVPAHESAPGNEEWGNRGWTFPTIERATAKFEALVAADIAKFDASLAEP